MRRPEPSLRSFDVTAGRLDVFKRSQVRALADVALARRMRVAELSWSKTEQSLPSKGEPFVVAVALTRAGAQVLRPP